MIQIISCAIVIIMVGFITTFELWPACHSSLCLELGID